MGQFTEILTELIERAGGQNALAREAGLDNSVPSRLLSGERKPTRAIVVALSVAYPDVAERLRLAFVNEVIDSLVADIRKQDEGREADDVA